MSQNIFSRNHLNPNITLFVKDSNGDTFLSVDAQTIVESIRHWKNILAEQENITVNNKIGIGISNIDIRYYTCIFAVFELGGVIPILDTVSVASKQKPRCRVMAPFDLFLTHESAPVTIKNLGLWYANKILDIDCWFDYASTQNHYHADKLLPNGNSIAILCPSSGSTGDPSVVSYTHEWLLAVGEYCAKLFNYSENDRILHLTNLHHGGSSGCFFFPTLKYCREHYFIHGLDADAATVKKIVDTIVDCKINRVMFPNSILLDQVLSLLPKLDHVCHFYTLQANQRAWISKVKKANLATVTSIFGSSETLGPIFTNVITPDGPDDHNVLAYKKPEIEFYSVSIIDNNLHVVDATGKRNTLKDRFEVDINGHYVYKSRSNFIRINEVHLALGTLISIGALEFEETTAAIVADTVMNKIYLLIDCSLQDLTDTTAKINTINSELHAIDSKLKIDYVDYVDFSNFISSIKINRELVVEHFRRKFNLI